MRESENIFQRMTVSPKVSECTLTQLDLFTASLTQDSIEDSAYLALCLIATIAQATPLPIFLSSKDFKLKPTWARDCFILMCAADSNFQLQIKSASFYVENESVSSGENRA